MQEKCSACEAHAERRTENRERRTERAASARRIGHWGTARMGNRRLRRLKPIRGRLPPAGQGALTRPGEQRTERAGAKRQTFHGHREQNAPAGRRVEWCARAFRSHRRQGRRSRLQPLWLLQASKPLNFQASLERPACASTPLICNKSVKSALPLRRALCVPLWFFVFLAVEGLALWACTVIAAQRSVSSPPRAAGRAFTSVAPPSLQASKLPSFQKTILWRGWICYTSANAEEGE